MEDIINGHITEPGYVVEEKI